MVHKSCGGSRRPSSWGLDGDTSSHVAVARIQIHGSAARYAELSTNDSPVPAESAAKGAALSERHAVRTFVNDCLHVMYIMVGRHGGSSGHFCLPHFGFVPSVSRRCWMPGRIVSPGLSIQAGFPSQVAFRVLPRLSSIRSYCTTHHEGDHCKDVLRWSSCGSALPCHVHSLISMRRLLRHVRATSAESGASYARGGPIRLRRRPAEEAVETGYATPLEGVGRLGLPKPISSFMTAPHFLLLRWQVSRR